MNTVKKFESVKLTVQAVQFTGENVAEIVSFVGSTNLTVEDGDIFINTKEGHMEISVGDWAVKEPFPTGDRDFYPVKEDIFLKRYRPAGQQQRLELWFTGVIAITAVLFGFVSGIMFAIWFSHN